MSDINIQMQQRNANNTAWDNVNPKTTASNVLALDGSSVESHLAENVKQLGGKQDTLPVANRRKITFGTAIPTGGLDGDIYFQYE